MLAAVQASVAALQQEFPGVAVEERGGEIHVAIPDAFRVGHEAHFAQVTREFLRILRDRRTLPAWERPNMLAKYYVSTKGTELSHQRPLDQRLESPGELPKRGSGAVKFRACCARGTADIGFL